ncbi:MAG: hypothetical protein ACTSRK_12060 [Promethearchaeota archaeon]
MTSKIPLISHILQNYRPYIQFQNKMMLNPSELSEEEFISMKNDFSQIFRNINDISIWQEIEIKLKQFYLKYLTQFSTIANFDYKIFMDVLLRKASFLQKFKLDIKSVQNLYKLSEQIKILGYNSVYDAYLKIFQVDGHDLIQNLQIFLKSSEKEYRLLFSQQIQSMGDSASILGNHIKTKLYKGKWLDNKYLNRSYLKIISRTQAFLQKNKFLSTKKMQQINILQGKSATLLGGYESITFPITESENFRISYLNVFLKESPEVVPSKRNIAHELGHCVQILNLTQVDLFEKLLPYESAVSELGGTLFESLMCFPDFIADVFEISDKSQCQLIAQYNRLMDLFFKRYYAISLLTYAEIFNSGRLSLKRVLHAKKNFKKRSLEILGIRNAKLHLLRLDLVHFIDFIRGHLFIQEPFMQACEFSLQTFLEHRETLLSFFSHGVSQPFERALHYFEDEIFHKSTVKKNFDFNFKEPQNSNETQDLKFSKDLIESANPPFR